MVQLRVGEKDVVVTDHHARENLLYRDSEFEVLLGLNKHHHILGEYYIVKFIIPGIIVGVPVRHVNRIRDINTNGQASLQVFTKFLYPVDQLLLDCVILKSFLGSGNFFKNV